MTENNNIMGSINEVIDLEDYAKKGLVPPKGKHYKVRIDKQHYDLQISNITGRELLALAQKNPPERYRLDQKLHGGATKKVDLAEVVDLTTPGIERFMTLPLDQTEGQYE